MLTKIAVISREFARRYKYSTFGIVFLQSAVEFFQTLSNGLYEHVQAQKKRYICYL